jgi:hypothetical protein
MGNIDGKIQKRTDHCRDVSLPESRIACRPVWDEQMALKDTKARDDLKRELDEAIKAYDGREKIASVDPGAEMLVELLNNAVTVEQIQRVRIVLPIITLLIGRVPVGRQRALGRAPRNLADDRRLIVLVTVKNGPS